MNLALLHTNDVHGYLTPMPMPDGSTSGGYARRAALIHRLRAGNPATLLLDAGDIYQGSRYWHAFRGQPDIALMNALGYDAATLGNHDFDGGLELLAQRLSEARFPVLCANFTPRPASPLAGLWRSHVILTAGDWRVAVFGLTIETPELYPPDFGAHIEVTPYLERAAALVPALRRQADVVILLSHLGQKGDEAVAASVPGIDLIIGGHNHHPLEQPLYIAGTPIVRGPVGAPSLCETRLHRGTGGGLHLEAHLRHPLDARLRGETRIRAAVESWTARLPTAEVIGHLSDPLDTRTAVKCRGENRAGNFFTDFLMHAFAGQAEIALVHMGTLRGDRVYPPGAFTTHDLQEFHPFDNPPALLEINAPQLKQVLEHGVSALPYPTGIFLSFSGLRVWVDVRRRAQRLNSGAPVPGARIVRAVFNGEEIDFRDPRRTFRLACDGYMASGGAGYSMLRSARRLQRVSGGANRILRAYLSGHSPVRVPLEGRIVMLSPV